ncbi:hypothetical protein ACKS0A_04950 [Histoplasma ohiense]
MPSCAIFTLQVRQGQVLQYNVAPSPIRSRPASNRAFSSAWMQRQVDSAAPPPSPQLQRGHPPSLQFFVFRGVPLYPVLITRLPRTRTHPTRRFMQLLRWAARDASCMKY